MSPPLRSETCVVGRIERRRRLYASVAVAALTPARIDLAALPCAVRSSSIAAAGWRFLCIGEVANFASLRRRLGTKRADTLVADIVARIEHLLPVVDAAAVSRDTVEFRFDGHGVADVDHALAALSDGFAAPLDIDGEPVGVRMRFAGAATLLSELDEVHLVEQAEEAIAIARTEPGCIVRDLTREPESIDRSSLERELEHAIANGEMFLQYQPKVHVRRQEVSSVEALVRWQHPVRGLILPGEFIAIAEESHQIEALTLWTLDQVIADQRRLAARGHDLTVFVNISGQLLGSSKFVAEACRRVAQGGAAIGFEVTETSVIRDPKTAIAHLQRFAEMGISIAIDDYGAGLSSLAYLKQLPARELKIDKLFVLQLTSSNRDPLIVRSTIDLAHALEMEVTAEGVETQAAMALLSVMGCDVVQGFLISRPIPIEALERFLDDGAHLAAPAPLGMFDRPASFWQSA